MPRGPHLDAPDTLRHVMGRGIEGRAIFRDDLDRDDFLTFTFFSIAAHQAIRISRPQHHGFRVDGGGRICEGYGAHACSQTPDRAESRERSAEILLALTLHPQHKTKFFLSQKILDRGYPVQSHYHVRSCLPRFIRAL